MNIAIQRSMIATLFCLTAPLNAEPYNGPKSFDFAHVDLAIRYHLAPSEELLNEMAESAAATHLKRHSDRTGYYPANASSRDITDDLMAKSPTSDTLQAVRELMLYAARNTAKQEQCMATAASYLPDKAQPRNSLHVTWGYDIGVAMDDHASLNFVHPHFLTDHQEVWFYCIHEVHHSGLMQIQPMPRIADIDTVRELYRFARYATFLEGLAVHSAYETRRLLGALGSDKDYLALSNGATLDRILATYEEGMSYLKSEVDRPLLPEHWQVVEEMSSGERLWYVAGAAMAAAIEKAKGRAYLLTVTLQGPDALFDAYDRVSAESR